MTDDETSGGSHGFQIVHEREKTHHFSSSEFRVIKDWMKAIMKATITRDYSGGSRIERWSTRADLIWKYLQPRWCRRVISRRFR